MKKLLLLLVVCWISSIAQAQLTEDPSVDKQQPYYVKVKSVRVHIFGVDVVIAIDAYRMAGTWSGISSLTVLSYIDPQTKEEIEIPISSIERIVGNEWVSSNLDGKYWLKDFGGTAPYYCLHFRTDDKMPESLALINIKEKVSRGWKWKGIHIKPVNYHYREDKNIGGHPIIDSLINHSNIPCAGIYENTDEDFSFAIIENKKEPCMVFYDGNSSSFFNAGGDIIADLKVSASTNLFIGTFYDYANQTSERIKLIFDKGIMTMIREDKSELSFIKTRTSKTNSNSSAEGSGVIASDLKATGSGFIVSDKVVVTNYHVIENASAIKVSININGTFEDFQARVLSTDKTNDIALIAIKDDNFTPLKPTPYSIASNLVDVGTSIFTIGYPMSNVLGQEAKITDGLISSKTGYNNDAVTYQISAPVQPGNSGGPLFDKKGHVVGIVNAGIPVADNVGYAIKSSYLLSLIDSAPIDIPLPKGKDIEGKDLPEIIKAYIPYITLIKVY